ETRGLPGSAEFLRQWQGAPIKAAITMDFVGSGRIFVAPFPEPPALWANRLLASAQRATQTSRVSFDPWLTVVPRLLPVPYGADHISFLAGGVPALNLSCEFPNWTYHTPEDTAQRVERKSLVTALQLMIAMIQELDREESPPTSKDPGYLPMAFPSF